MNSDLWRRIIAAYVLNVNANTRGLVLQSQVTISSRRAGPLDLFPPHFHKNCGPYVGEPCESTLVRKIISLSQQSAQNLDFKSKTI
jgi:hypothetical protein